MSDVNTVIKNLQAERRQLEDKTKDRLATIDAALMALAQLNGQMPETRMATAVMTPRMPTTRTTLPQERRSRRRTTKHRKHRRKCLQCQRGFNGKSNARFCSNGCNDLWYQLNKRVAYEKRCDLVSCGQAFRTASPTARFHTPGCAAKARWGQPTVENPRTQVVGMPNSKMHGNGKGWRSQRAKARTRTKSQYASDKKLPGRPWVKGYSPLMHLSPERRSEIARRAGMVAQENRRRRLAEQSRQEKKGVTLIPGDNTRA